jgi:hypothetical protein
MSGRASAVALVASASAAVASLAWWAFGAAEVAEPGPPTGALGPVIASEAHLPAIGEVTRYDVNEANPFAPSWTRARVKDERLSERDGDPAAHGGGAQHVVEERPLPPPQPLSRAAFGCIGVIAANGHETLVVRLPGGATRAIVVGEAVPAAAGGWVLEALEPGGIARFRDPAGAVEQLRVGDGAQLASVRNL